MAPSPELLQVRKRAKMQMLLFVAILLMINAAMVMIFVALFTNETHKTECTSRKRKRKRRRLNKLDTRTHGSDDVASEHSHVSTSKGRKKITNINLLDFINDINSHLSIIASAISTTQKHYQSLMARELELAKQRKNLFSEVKKIPGLSRDQVINAVIKLASDTSRLIAFYEASTVELKKEFILALLGPGLPSSSKS